MSEKEVNVKELGERVFLDSGTLTPLLKNLEAKGYVKRKRSEADERNLLISLTGKGEKLKEKAAGIPEKIAVCINLNSKESGELYTLLYRLLNDLKEQ